MLFLSETICYDDACHLKRYAEKRSHLPATSTRVAAMEIVCDRFHFGNHTDTWCRKNCNPYNSDVLKVKGTSKLYI